MARTLAERNLELEAENAALRAELKEAKQKVQYLLKQLFGKKSEAIDLRQLELLLSGIETTPAPEPPAVVRDPRPPRRQPAQKEDAHLDFLGGHGDSLERVRPLVLVALELRAEAPVVAVPLEAEHRDS